MNSAILTTESSEDLKLLLKLAKKINITTKLLSKEDEEELGLINAIKSKRTKTIEDEIINQEALLSESTLSEDWDREEEDLAWAYLQKGQ